MVQELHVLRCFSCDTFQSHIVKKSKKWECKICGEKQSVKQVYGRGSGKDCRLHVQKLNTLKGEKSEDQLLQDRGVEHNQLLQAPGPPSAQADLTCTRESKWAAYVDEVKIDLTRKPSPTRETTSSTRSRKGNGLKRQRKGYLNEQYGDEYCDSVENYGSFEDISSSTFLAKNTKKLKKSTKFSKVDDDRCLKSSALNNFNTFPINDKDQQYFEKNQVENYNLPSQNNYPALCLASSLKNTTRIENINNDDDNETFEIMNKVEASEDMCEDINQPTKGSKKCVNTITKTNVSLKWAKYLDDEEDVENSSSRNSNTALSPVIKNKYANLLTSKNENDSINVSSLNLSNHKKSNDSYPCESFNLESSDDCFDNHKSSSASNRLSLVTSGHLALPASKDSRQKHGHHRNDTKSNLSSSVPVPVFEQDCDLSDSDFQLDF